MIAQVHTWGQVSRFCGILKSISSLEATPFGQNDRMPAYSQFIDGIFSNTNLLKKLRPSELADPFATIRVRESSDGQLTNDRSIANEKLFPLVRAALLYD